MVFERATMKDIDEVANLYNELIDSLEKGINYPGWKHGVYPTRETAQDGIRKGVLFVLREDDGRIAGTSVLVHEGEPAYDQADWHVSLDDKHILVVFTFAVHPRYLQKGMGTKLMEAVIDYAIREKMKAIRLDVYEKNFPAIALYKKCGFEYIGTVDLGCAKFGLPWFELYQKLL